MKKSIFLVLIFPLFAYSQRYEDLDSASKAKVDSMVNRMSMIKNMKSHRKMVSFCEWSLDSLDDFWSYLIYNLRYSTDQKDNSVNLERTPTGFVTRLIKYTSGYQQTKQTLRIEFTCNSDGEKIKQVKITGPLSLLSELYLKYWEAKVSPDFTKSGALEKTYLPLIETIWLYHDKILIKPFKAFSNY
jgi:hypothetical protein